VSRKRWLSWEGITVIWLDASINRLTLRFRHRAKVRRGTQRSGLEAVSFLMAMINWRAAVPCSREPIKTSTFRAYFFSDQTKFPSISTAPRDQTPQVIIDASMAVSFFLSINV